MTILSPGLQYFTESYEVRLARLNELILAAIEAEDRITISSTTVTSIDGNPATRKEKK